MRRKENAMFKMCELVRILNEGWKAQGQKSEIVIKNENITITGKEIIVKIPVEMEIRIPVDKLDAETVSPCSKPHGNSK